MTSPGVLLAHIGDLYVQLSDAREENEALRQALAQQAAAPEAPASRPSKRPPDPHEYSAQWGWCGVCDYDEQAPWHAPEAPRAT